MEWSDANRWVDGDRGNATDVAGCAARSLDIDSAVIVKLNTYNFPQFFLRTMNATAAFFIVCGLELHFSLPFSSCFGAFLAFDFCPSVGDLSDLTDFGPEADVGVSTGFVGEDSGVDFLVLCGFLGLSEVLVGSSLSLARLFATDSSVPTTAISWSVFFPPFWCPYGFTASGDSRSE